MKIEKILTDPLKKSYVEAIQVAIIGGISSLLYSEFIRCMKYKDIPRPRYMIPPIRSVSELLSPTGHMMTKLNERLLTYWTSHLYIHTWSQDLIDFITENDDLDDIISTYIFANAYKTIPMVFNSKFDLDNPESIDTFIEDPSIDMFDRKPLTDEHIDFIMEQSILHLILNGPKEPEFLAGDDTGLSVIKLNSKPADGSWINDNPIKVGHIIGIGNVKAVCPIYIDSPIMKMNSIMKLIESVTNTTLTIVDEEEKFISIKTASSNEIEIFDTHSNSH